MLTPDPNKAAIVWPAEQQDTIIYADTVNFNITNTASTSGGFFVDNTASGVGPIGLPFGIYSVDGGANWYEMNEADGPLAMRFRAPDSNTTLPLLNWNISSLVPGYANGATVPVLCKVGLFALPQSTIITSGGVNHANVIAYRSGANYNKLFLQGEIAKVTSGGGATTGSGVATIPHNLGYVPTVKVWDHSGGWYGRADIYGITAYGISVDETNLYLAALSGATGSYAYRIYYES
jgi:hypothetical protein